jgi:hypothetical protein
MAGRLVTIATFDQPPKARLAQNALEEAGIKATVADETTVAMDWLLGAAVGWVKVQVLEEDADRAVTVLEEALGPSDPVDAKALEAEAETAEPEEGSAPPPPSPRDDDPEPPLSERDEYARRFYLSAVFGLVFVPLWFYAVYLFLNAAYGEGPLSDRSKRKLRLGVLAMMFGSCMAFIFWLVVARSSLAFFVFDF